MTGTVTVVGQGEVAAAIATERNNKEVICKSCCAFTDCISEKNSIQVDIL